MNYKIRIENGCFQREVAKIRPKLMIVDKNVKNDNLTNIDIPIKYVEVSENTKNFELYFKLIDILYQAKINRSDTVAFVGGGVLLDVGGFAASTFKRGINFVNVPTTSLSMIDSSVGSKNGLNHRGVKNLIGNITDPQQVIIDTSFLHSLDTRNYNNGLAEAIKIGYLSNLQIINLLNTVNFEIEDVIKLCVSEKLKYVESDKFDIGYRNYLNFGHTFGHAIESITNFQQFLHGEAVSIGMVIASGYDQTLIDLLTKFSLPTELPTMINVDKLIELMANDKKNNSHKIKVILKNPELAICNLSTQQVKKLFKMELVIKNKLQAKNIIVNKSKSHLHRLLAATLALRVQAAFDFNVDNDLSDDVQQSLSILTACNVKISFENEKLVVDARDIKTPTKVLTIYKSATTFRVFTPILCCHFGAIEINLDEQLKNRPHPIFDQHRRGDVYDIDFSPNGYQLDGSISSQFISGYVFALVARNEDAQIEIVGELTSVPYIDMTIAVVNSFGCNVMRLGNDIIIKQVKTYKQQLSAKPELDFSSLAYFIVHNKLVQLRAESSLIELEDYNFQSMQADSQILNYLECREVDMVNCPDLLPILVVYGLLNKRGIRLLNTDRIKYKECDRRLAMVENFKDLNAIVVTEGTVEIQPVEQISSRVIKCYGDHRIAMACSIIADFCIGELIIDDYSVVQKSFPTFFKQLRRENECLK